MGEKGEKSFTKRDPASPEDGVVVLGTAPRSEGEGTFSPPFFFCFLMLDRKCLDAIFKWRPGGFGVIEDRIFVLTA